MKYFESLSNELILKEYKKTFLLNIFQKLCVRMEREKSFKKKIQNLFLQSYNRDDTTRLIIKNEFNIDIDVDDSKVLYNWIQANLTKNSTRRNIPIELKKELYKIQDGKCMACGEDLGNDWEKIHVDHIIPFKLVGDELKDNYQDLCDTCNECKSSKIDYIFKAILKLN